MIQYSVLFLYLLHAFHVSVTEIAYKQSAQSLQITQRIFFDDLEKGIQKAIGNDEYRLGIPLDAHAKVFLIDQTSVKVLNQTAKLLGAEEEQDLVWVYFELENVNIGDRVTMESSLLNQTYKDQENLVHFKLPSGKETFRLNADTEKVNIVIN